MKPAYFLLPAFLASSLNAMTLPESTVRPYECETCDALSHAAVSSNWRIQNTSLQHDGLRQQKSRKYRVVTTRAALEKGLPLSTRAPAAVVSIAPLGKQTTPVKANFRIQKNNLDMSLNDAASLLSQNEAVPDSEFTTQNLAMFQLKPELGAGKFILSSKAAGGQANDRFVVQVLDQGSTTYLHIETNKSHYQYGDEMTATFRLQDGAYGYPIDVITASVVGPDGQAIPLTLKKEKWDTYVARIRLTDEKNTHGKNWYVEADISTILNDEEVLRHVHSAISYAIPSAAITDIKVQKGRNFDLIATVDVATASRYALQAVFMGTNSQGKREAIESVHSAAWLSPGQSQLNFSLSTEIANKYKPPYYLASITLVDYGQLKPVYEFNKPTDIGSIR